MKILLLVGSYRKNGNTARVVGLIEDQLREVATRDSHNKEALEIEIINLAHQDIRFCRGCRVCFDKGEEKCPLKDDLLAIKSKMAEADGIVISSPVYVNDVTGIVKNWMDRLAFVNHRPEFAGKCAYLVTTVGDGPTRHALRTLNLAMSQWGFYIVGQAGFKTGALMDKKELEARYEQKTARIARGLFYAIQERRFAKPSLISLMTFQIQQRYWQRTVEESIDYTYWKSRGWTEPHCEFYIQTRVNAVKVAFARLSGAVIARFVT